MSGDPQAPPRTQMLCALDDLVDGESAGLVAEIGGERSGLIVVRQGDDVYVYVNSCPHIGAPLDFMPGQFLTADKTMILCSTHGAVFQIEDGLCVQGPCVNRSLEPVACEVRGGEVWLTA